ncbi:MAG: hypothetical protein D6742_10915 [Cyanobacteria bacterium J069]|nr:MAG: hypothetical protein D6742_10915 [Cyanobacteria bacterium J069]
MSDQLSQSSQLKPLKQLLKDFVLDAEGVLATALETYGADRLRHWSATNLQGINRSDLAIDMFLTEGQVEGQSVPDLFIQETPRLSQDEKALIQSWKRAFNGLFVVLQVDADCYEVKNWLTEKSYRVKPHELQSSEELSRLSPGEILVTRLLPDGEDDWTFSGPLMLLGKLGKPKLAVAIGNFKNWFPHHLYGDAPELLESAWLSVERYHDSFVEFFGESRVTLPGHELNKRLQAYQDQMTQRHLEEVGIDTSKSLKELVSESGVSEAEVAESAAVMGGDHLAVSHLLKSDQAIKMVMPPINLPDELRRADAVTIFVHPRWGQTFLKDYTRLTQLLASTEAEAATETAAAVDRIVQKYLQTDAVTPDVWRCLAEEQPEPLTAALRRYFNRPALTLDELDQVLLEAGKPAEPVLPEIASAPVHLHNLFEEALQEVNRNSSKKRPKDKRKPKSGFAGSGFAN